MKARFTFSFLFCLFFSSQAQIVLDSADLSGYGSRFIFAYDTLVASGSNPGASGSGQTWNMIAFTTHLIDTVDVKDPATTPYSTNFPGSNICLQTLTFGDTTFTYATASALEVRINGFVLDPLQTGNKFVVSANPPALSMTFPWQLGSSYTDYSGGGIEEAGANVGFPTVDSVRYHSYSNRNVTVDAEGILTLSSGSYSCLREKEISTTKDTIWAKLPFVGWSQIQETDVTDSIYRWVNDSLGGTIAEFSFDDAGLAKTFKYLSPNASLSFAKNLKEDFQLYPNPAEETVFVQSENSFPFSVQIFNLEGRLIGEYNNQFRKCEINLTNLAPGMYSIKWIENQTGKLGVKKLTVQH